MLALMPCNGFGNLFSRKLAVTLEVEYEVEYIAC
jgi:hypothetical protein